MAARPCRLAGATLVVVAFVVCAGAWRLPLAAGLDLSTPVVVLVALDGFRPDYLDRFDAPVLRRLAREGVRADLVPVFPTKTYPNHHSIATGLYPEHHGILANEMWDPVWQQRFDRRALGTPQYDRWWEGEPIWVTARKAQRLVTAMFWPGTDAEILGWRPNDWSPFDGSFPNEARVARVLGWFDRPAAERPSVVTLYFSDADDDGHRYGPESPRMAESVARLDRLVGTLLAGLEARGLADAVDLFVLSDHGMTATPRAKAIVLDELIDLADVDVSDWTPTLWLWPKPGREEQVYRRLRGAHPHLAVYRRSELPPRWHLAGHRRVSPILAVADEGWTIVTKAQLARANGRWVYGHHGYDNALASMRAVFVARGPHIRRGARVPPFENIHLYALVCRILRVAPAPNDGRLAAVAGLLADGGGEGGGGR